jgi:hypothetical protein
MDSSTSPFQYCATPSSACATASRGLMATARFISTSASGYFFCSSSSWPWRRSRRAWAFMSWSQTVS